MVLVQEILNQSEIKSNEQKEANTENLAAQMV